MTGPTVSLREAQSACRYCGGAGKFQVVSPVSDGAWAACFCSRLAQPAPPTEATEAREDEADAEERNALFPSERATACTCADKRAFMKVNGVCSGCGGGSATVFAQTEATPPHDGLRTALRSIAEGNLGDLPWQANYERIRQVAAAALTSEVQPAGLGYAEAFAWLAAHTAMELHHYSPMRCDDDDQAEEWRVTRVSGSINDREWTVVGRGETPLAAIQSAIRTLASGELA